MFMVVACMVKCCVSLMDVLVNCTLALLGSYQEMKSVQAQKESEVISSSDGIIQIVN